jgi:D-aminopeptidase
MAERGARGWGLPVGRLPTGPHNRLTDVLGVRVGHRTVREQDVRTGVTVVLPHRGNPFREKVAAGMHVANGYTKAAGLEQVRELGTLESPVAITNTLAVGRVLAGLVGLLCDLDPGIGSDADGTVNAVVLECNDGWLNDIRRPAVAERHVADAVAAASEEVAEGGVGAGTGMRCYGLAGGIGTASRLAGERTVGALVCANFGRTADLRLGDRHVGPLLAERLGGEGEAVPPGQPPDGSAAVVLATDAPLDGRQLGRLARRGEMGIARTGTPVAAGSGDVAVAFSTAARLPHRPGPEPRGAEVLDDAALDELFAATAEAVEEAVYNALLAATPVTGREGRRSPALVEHAAALGLQPPTS